MRTKAEFKALREMCGLTQSALAYELGVEVRSVKRWESDAAPQNAPQDAWDVLDAAIAQQQKAIQASLEEVERLIKEHGEPKAVRLNYWKSEEDYLAHSTDAQYGVTSDWRMANANIRALASVLESRGIAVEWVDNVHPDVHLDNDENKK